MSDEQLAAAHKVTWLGPDRPVEGGTVYVKPEALVLPAPSDRHPDGGAPIWHTDDGTVTAYPQGIELDGYLHEDIDELERTALAVLAAVQAVRGMKP